MLFKIGELAKRTGLTIRTLRHYDDIGLLSPSRRSEGGFRLYDLDDVRKLYRIQALSRLQLPLAEIGRVLSVGGASFPGLVARQIAALDQQIEHAVVLRDRLAGLQARHRQSASLSTDDWLGALEQMSARFNYFSAEERHVLAAHHASLEPARDEEKAALAGALTRLMAQGIDADSDAAKELAYRWIALLLEEVGGDEGLLMKYYAMQWHEAPLQMMSGVDRAGMTYLAHAMAYRRLDIYATYCSSAEIAQLRRHYVGCTTAWPPLIAALRSQMAQGVHPGDPALQLLAGQWRMLSGKKAGGDAQLAAKLRQAFMDEPALRFGSGIDTPFLGYLQAALQRLPQEPANHPGGAAA